MFSLKTDEKKHNDLVFLKTNQNEIKHSYSYYERNVSVRPIKTNFYKIKIRKQKQKEKKKRRKGNQTEGKKTKQTGRKKTKQTGGKKNKCQ